jgi:toxin secretion/phage lysis holin
MFCTSKFSLATKGIAAVLGVVGATIVKALGGWDVALQVLVALIALDYLTGVIVAIAEKKLNSDVGFRGLLKKMMIFALVYVSVLVSSATGSDFIRLLVIMFYIANEAISVLENAGKLGVPYPKKLKELLEQLKKDNDEGKKDDPK